MPKRQILKTDELIRCKDYMQENLKTWKLTNQLVSELIEQEEEVLLSMSFSIEELEKGKGKLNKVKKAFIKLLRVDTSDELEKLRKALRVKFERFYEQANVEDKLEYISKCVEKRTKNGAVESWKTLYGIDASAEMGKLNFNVDVVNTYMFLFSYQHQKPIFSVQRDPNSVDASLKIVNKIAEALKE